MREDVTRETIDGDVSRVCDALRAVAASPVEREEAERCRARLEDILCECDEGGVVDVDALCVYAVEVTEECIARSMRWVRRARAETRGEAVKRWMTLAAATAAAERAWAGMRRRGREKEIECVEERARRRTDAFERVVCAVCVAEAFAPYDRDAAAAAALGFGDGADETAVDGCSERIERVFIESGMAHHREHREGVDRSRDAALEFAFCEHLALRCAAPAEALKKSVEDCERGALERGHVYELACARVFGRMKHSLATDDEDIRELVVDRCPALMAQYVTWMKDARVEAHRDGDPTASPRAITALARWIKRDRDGALFETTRGRANFFCAVFNALAVVVAASVDESFAEFNRLDDVTRDAEALAADVADGRSTSDAMGARGDDWDEADFGVLALNMALERLARAVDDAKTKTSSQAALYE